MIFLMIIDQLVNSPIPTYLFEWTWNRFLDNNYFSGKKRGRIK